MIRILLADDHTIVRAGLKQIFALVPDIAVAGEAENAAQTLALLQAGGVDLLLMDLNMPGTSGYALVERVRASHADLPILVLSMHNEAPMAANVLRAGANGYITKDCDLGVLLPAIYTVAAHGHYLAPGLAEKIAFHATAQPKAAPHLQLTPREAEVFGHLVQGLGILAISERLGLGNKTVSTHKLRLLRKLHCRNMAELMRYAAHHGLLN